MKNRIELSKFNWFLQKTLSGLTLYRLLIVAVLVWLVGCWTWIIPVYLKKISILKIENQRISQDIVIQPEVNQIHQEKKEIGQLSYANLLLSTQQHRLQLEEFRLTGSSQNEYQIMVKGSWLNVREFLSELTESISSGLIIESLNFQRDQTTNEVALTILVSTIGSSDEITSEPSR